MMGFGRIEREAEEAAVREIVFQVEEDLVDGGWIAGALGARGSRRRPRRSTN
jgi:hypothetical protein